MQRRLVSGLLTPVTARPCNWTLVTAPLVAGAPATLCVLYACTPFCAQSPHPAPLTLACTTARPGFAPAPWSRDGNCRVSSRQATSKGQEGTASGCLRGAATVPAQMRQLAWRSVLWRGVCARWRCEKPVTVTAAAFVAAMSRHVRPQGSPYRLVTSFAAIPLAPAPGTAASDEIWGPAVDPDCPVPLHSRFGRYLGRVFVSGPRL